MKRGDLKRLEEKLHQWLPIPGSTACDARAAGVRDAEAPINAAVLAEVCGGDAVAVRTFLARFQSFNETDAQALKQAVANLDMPEVAHASHRMKGAGRTVGALALASVCERIERAARANEGLGGIESTLALLDHELERLDRYLRDLHQDGKAHGARPGDASLT